MRRYLVLINWNDASGTEIEVMARTKHDAINSVARGLSGTQRDAVYSYVVLKRFNKGE